MAGSDGKGTASLDEKSTFVLENGVWLYRDSDKEFQKSQEQMRERRRARAVAKSEEAKRASSR